MRALLINAIADRGSTGRICRDIMDSLSNVGHETKLLYALGTSDNSNAVKITNNTDIKINAILARISGYNGHACFKSTKRAIEYIEEFKPDIVHLHNIHSNFINIKELLDYINSKKIPIVITLHDCWYFTGKCTHYTAANCIKWKTECTHCPKLRGDFPSILFDQTKKMWHEKKISFEECSNLGVIAVSNWIFSEAQESPFFKSSKMRVIYNWIDTDVFSPKPNPKFKEKYGILNNKKIIFCVSESWTENTDRFSDLIELAEKIGDGFCILVAGNLKSQKNIPSQLIPTGYLSINDLVECYSNSDVYVHLSREDTFGKVIAEALSCGTPAVVYDSTACPEIIEDGCGFAVPVGNLDEMITRIQLITTNDKNCYSQKCRESAVRRFKKESLLDDTVSFYQELIEN